MTDKIQIVFVSSNKAKGVEAKYAITPKYFKAMHSVDLPETQSNDYIKIIHAKADEYIDNYKKFMLDKSNIKTENQIENIYGIIEDTGFEFDNLNGFPGPFIRYYLEKLQMPKICEMHAGAAATFVSHSACVILSKQNIPGEYNYYFSKKICIHGHKVRGQIIGTPRGTNGYGIETIFIPDGADKTLAEMELDEKQYYSARIKSISDAKNWIVKDIN